MVRGTLRFTLMSPLVLNINTIIYLLSCRCAAGLGFLGTVPQVTVFVYVSKLLAGRTGAINLITSGATNLRTVPSCRWAWDLGTVPQVTGSELCRQVTSLPGSVIHGDTPVSHECPHDHPELLT